MASPRKVMSGQAGSDNGAGHGGDKAFQIRRKPVASKSTPTESSTLSTQKVGVVRTESITKKEIFATTSDVKLVHSDVSLQTSLPHSILTDAPVVASPGATSASTTSLASPPVGAGSIDTSISSTKSTGSYVAKAYQEARHFVGGLITHPTESNKHFTILRHSHGIVFYQGSNTFLAISVFSDVPLPPDRTFWLQNKGWTGKTGMRAKALFRLNDSWLNVTPTLAIQPDQVAPTDERAWQRDINRFKKKVLHSVQERHQLRETAILRIPVEAGDGYFQFVLCQGEKKKVLCNSPTFRVISTSSSPSSLRGASLSTLPLELGAYIGSRYAQTTVQTLLSPITTTVQSRVQVYLPSSKTQLAASTAYSVSGLEDRVNTTIEDANTRYDEVEDKSFFRAEAAEVDLEAGPVPPYPLTFVAHVENGPIVNHALDVSKPNLTRVPPDILQRLHGVYLGWVRVLPGKQKTGSEKVPLPQPWQQSLISASCIIANVKSVQSLKTTVAIRLIEAVEMASHSRLEVRIMGFMHSQEISSLQKAIDAGDEAALEEKYLLEVCDIQLAQSTLDHPAWGPDGPAWKHDIATGKEQAQIIERTKDGYARARMTGQRLVSRVPFDRVGMRVWTDELRDKTAIINGFYIPR